MLKLDKFDIQILGILQHNNKVTLQELSKMVNLSVPPCQKRVQYLRDNGVIIQDTVVLDLSKIQSHMTVFSHIGLNTHKKQVLDKIVTTLKSIDNITEIHNISGDYDFIIKMVVRDMTHYSETIFKIVENHAEIMNFKSEFVLRNHKSTPQLPVGAL